MKNTVKRGTARGIYSESLPLAGKTGTALAGYGGGDKSHYTGSFAGFFPADDPKYSCVVVVNQPDKSIGFYGSQVAAPVFKEIADKIYTRTPQVDTLKSIHIENPEVEKEFENYYTISQKYKTVMPNLIGLPAMDAVSILENMGLKTDLSGTGMIAAQSIKPGQSVRNYKTIKLTTR